MKLKNIVRPVMVGLPVLALLTSQDIVVRAQEETNLTNNLDEQTQDQNSAALDSSVNDDQILEGVSSNSASAIQEEASENGQLGSSESPVPNTADTALKEETPPERLSYTSGKTLASGHQLTEIPTSLALLNFPADWDLSQVYPVHREADLVVYAYQPVDSPQLIKSYRYQLTEPASGHSQVIRVYDVTANPPYVTQNWQADYRQFMVVDEAGQDKVSQARYYWQPLNDLKQIYTTQAAPDQGLLGITSQPARDIADISTELGISPEELLAHRQVDAARADLEKALDDAKNNEQPAIGAGPGNETSINDGKPYTSNEISLAGGGNKANQDNNVSEALPLASEDPINSRNKVEAEIAAGPGNETNINDGKPYTSNEIRLSDKDASGALPVASEAPINSGNDHAGKIADTLGGDSNISDDKPYSSTNIILEGKGESGVASHADGVKYNPKESSVPSHTSRPLYLQDKQTGQLANTTIVNLPSSRGTALEKLENQVKQDQQVSQSSPSSGLTRTSHRVVVAQANRAQGDSKLATGLQDLGRQLGHSLAMVTNQFSRPLTNTLESASTNIGRWLGEEEVTAADHQTDQVVDQLAVNEADHNQADRQVAQAGQPASQPTNSQADTVKDASQTIAKGQLLIYWPIALVGLLVSLLVAFIAKGRRNI
ncbi:hypothetical protein AWM75_05445 [Aerococcus urinaehominis]|uniref:Uncharacterized protein n=1 Tax=Aerococcus urinaehominis TaxID=128944 RepID=A0A0X8FMP1_9LACT|nr:hypothetical protein [Aerococcus urinaehominis]AMB99472.1 hypothetical protein AWM75_05445 [Aerococcus urinaehominis]